VRTESEVQNMTQKMGRPKSDNPMTERLYVRVTKEEKTDIMNFTAEHNCTILDLVRLGIKRLNEGTKK